MLYCAMYIQGDILLSYSIWFHFIYKQN